MRAGNFVVIAVTLLLGGFVLVRMADTLINADPNFGVVATAIIGAFIVGATAMLRKGRY